MTLTGADISNFQGPPEGYRDQAWYQQAQFLIVQSIRPPKPYAGWEVGGYTVAQLRAAKADGKKIGIYVFLWNTLADVASDIRARLAIIPDDLVLDMAPMVDVEDETACPVEQRKAAVDTARAVCDAWAAQRGLPPSEGYSRDEYIKDFLGGYWPDGWKYWQCAPGADPNDLLPMRPLRQFAIDSIDHDSMLESEIVASQSATSSEAPAAEATRETPDDWQWPTWREAAINLKSIADTLGQQLKSAQQATDPLKDQLQEAEAKIATALTALGGKPA